MSSSPNKVYIESTCFIEIAKRTISSGNPARDGDMWHLRTLLKAAKDGRVQIFTATLTLAECQHAGEPSSDGIPSDPVKTVFKNFLSSGQYLLLVQDTILVAERARNLRWVHGICMSGPDALHAASALEMRCDEILSFDQVFHKNKDKLRDLGLCVRLPRNTQALPPEYKQNALDLEPNTSSATLPEPNKGEGANV